MAYLTTIDLVSSDQLPEIEITLKDSNTAASGSILDPDDATTFAPLDLTSGTVRMRVRKVGSTTLTDTLVGTVTNATEGKVVDLIKFKVRSQFG